MVTRVQTILLSSASKINKQLPFDLFEKTKLRHRNFLLLKHGKYITDDTCPQLDNMSITCQPHDMLTPPCHDLLSVTSPRAGVHHPVLIHCRGNETIIYCIVVLLTQSRATPYSARTMKKAYECCHYLYEYIFNYNVRLYTVTRQ